MIEVEGEGVTFHPVMVHLKPEFAEALREEGRQEVRAQVLAAMGDQDDQWRHGLLRKLREIVSGRSR